MADNSYYFSHDYNARSDPKIKKLLARHGVAGYGIYWAIIEDLYNNANALRTHSDSNAIKGKEKKEYKKKVEGYSQSETAKRFQPPSEDEVKSFISEKGYNVDADLALELAGKKRIFMITQLSQNHNL
jgi:hypothetical protein